MCVSNAAEVSDLCHKDHRAVPQTPFPRVNKSKSELSPYNEVYSRLIRSVFPLPSLAKDARLGAQSVSVHCSFLFRLSCASQSRCITSLLVDVRERLREAEGTQPSHWLPFTSPRHKEEEKKTVAKNKRKMEGWEISAQVWPRFERSPSLLIRKWKKRCESVFI